MKKKENSLIEFNQKYASGLQAGLTFSVSRIFVDILVTGYRFKI